MIDSWGSGSTAPVQDYSWGAAVKSAADGLGGLLGTAGQIYFQYENQKFAKEMAQKNLAAQQQYLTSNMAYAQQQQQQNFGGDLGSEFSKIPMPFLLGGAALLFLALKG